MKRLYVQYLMVASALALGASALDFCNTGSIGSPLDVAMTTPGSDNYVVDCMVGNMVALTLTGADGPTQPLAPITMRLQRSTLGIDSRVSIIGKAEYAESLANATAYKFIVEDNVFSQGAMLYVRGAFAPNTVINIARNTFSIADPLTALFPDPPGRTDTMISAIYFHSLYLLNDVAVKVANNTIVGENTLGKVAVNAINFGADMYMYGDRSSISVTGNDVEITCNATESHGTAIGAKTLYVYGRDSRFAVERNVIRATGSSSVYRHPSIISAVAGSGVTSFTGNTVVANTTGMVAVDATTGFSPVIRLGSVTVNGNAVSAWINENVIDVTGPLASIGLEGEIQCGDNCAVYVADNRLSATGGNPSVFAQGRVDLRGTGALWITGNELRRTDGAATAAPVTIAADLRMVGTSALAVTRNTFSADSPNKMVEFGAAGKFSPAPSATASVFLCGNSFGGNVLADSGAISAVVSTDIANKATFDGCPATTTTTLPPTTTTTVATSATDEEATSSNTTDVSGSTTQPGATTTVSGTATSAVGATTTSSPVATTTDPNWSNKGTAAASLVGAIVAAAASIVVSLL